MSRALGVGMRSRTINICNLDPKKYSDSWKMNFESEEVEGAAVMGNKLDLEVQT